MVTPVDAPSIPLIVQIVNAFRDDLDRQIQVAVSLMGLSWVQVEAAVDAEIFRLAEAALRQYQETGLLPTEAQLFRMEQYRLLQDQVYLQIARYLDAVEGQITQFQRTAITTGVANAGTLIGAVGSEFGQAVQFSIFRLNEQAVENLVALARAGQPLQELMAATYGQASDGMIQQLVNGLAQGLNPRETARRMREEGLAKGFYHTELVARDMQLRSYRLAAQRQYQESGVVTTYTRIAAKSTRTCLACLALDGTVYPVAELMELHPGDRCAMIPNVDGLPRIEFQTGEQWFNTLNEQTQHEVMGPGRFDAWQEGKFAWGDMASVEPNAVWGPSARVTSLKELAG